MKKIVKASFGVAALAVVGTTLLAGPANAADVPNVKTIAAGSTGTLDWTYQQTSGVSWMPFDTTTISFVAPAHTTFTTQATVPTQTSNDGVAWSATALTVNGCTVSDAGARLNCTVSGPSNMNWGNTTYRRLSPTVQVDANAPAGTYSATTPMTVTVNGTSYNTAASLNVTVVAKPAAPTVSDIDNTTGTTVLSGEGVPGATVTIKDDQGNTVGTATVGADGKWSADLGSNFAGTASDLTVTQTANGLVSDPTTVSAADLPVANPAVAGGLAVAAIAAIGTVMLVRRKRATA